MKTACNDKHECLSGIRTECDYFEDCDCGPTCSECYFRCIRELKVPICENEKAWPENQPSDDGE